MAYSVWKIQNLFNVKMLYMKYCCQEGGIMTILTTKGTRHIATLQWCWHQHFMIHVSCWKSIYCCYCVSLLMNHQTVLTSCIELSCPVKLQISTVGSRTFPASGATVWNDLPTHDTSPPSLVIFRQYLKTFLFSRCYPDIVIWLINYAHLSLTPL